MLIKLQMIIHSCVVAIEALTDHTQWAALAVPFPATSQARAGFGILLAVIAAVLIVCRLLLVRMRLIHPMTIDVVPEWEGDARAEIKSKDASKFQRVLGMIKSGREVNVRLMLRDNNGKPKKARCVMRINQGTSIDPGHLKIDTVLAQTMNLGVTNAGGTFQSRIDIRAPSWWSSTFGSPDPDVRTQWVTGTVLGVVFMLLSLVLAPSP